MEGGGGAGAGVGANQQVTPSMLCVRREPACAHKHGQPVFASAYVGMRVHDNRSVALEPKRVLQAAHRVGKLSQPKISRSIDVDDQGIEEATFQSQVRERRKGLAHRGRGPRGSTA